MTEPLGAPTTETPVRIRRSFWELALGNPPAFLPFLYFTTHTHGEQWVTRYVPVVVAALLMVRFVTANWGVDLTSSHLISRWWGRRAIPWSRVQGFEVQSTWG